MTSMQLAADTGPDGGHIEAYGFGDPESVIDAVDWMSIFETTANGKWYEPPVPRIMLGKTFRMAAQHQSAILLKRNLLTGSFIPSPVFARGDFSRWVLDWLIYGDAYLEVVRNRSGAPIRLRPSPAAYTRVGVQPGQYWFVPGQMRFDQAHEFGRNAIFHMMEPDPLQEIYGQPEYLSALQSGLLNEAATLFRRRYYKNGSHAGFILYISEGSFGEEDSKALREALRQSKGPGNFRNFFIHMPNGKKDGVQLIPIAEVAAKDEFLQIKETTRDDLLAAHRVPPQLLGIVPKNTGGFGNVVDAANMFFEMEIVPIQQRLLELNDWLGMEAVRFKDRPDPVGSLTAPAPHPLPQLPPTRPAA